MSDIDGRKNRMTYVEWVSAVRTFGRNGLQYGLVLKRLIYALKIHTLDVACSGHILARMSGGMSYRWILDVSNVV